MNGQAEALRPLRFSQDDGAGGRGLDAAQKNRAGVREGVRMAGLKGHSSRSAVFLIH